MRKLPVIQNATAPLGPDPDSLPAAGPMEPFDASRELPALHEAHLDWEALDCVLADLDDFARPIEVQGRDASGGSQAFDDIVTARDSLVSGDSHAIQIMYAFADQVWIDTLLRNPEGARLLRMADAMRSSE